MWIHSIERSRCSIGQIHWGCTKNALFQSDDVMWLCGHWPQVIIELVMSWDINRCLIFLLLFFTSVSMSWECSLVKYAGMNMATPRHLKSRTMFRNYFYVHASPKMRNNWTTLHSCKWTLSKWACIILKQLNWEQSSQLICFGDHKTLKLTKYAKSVETIARSLYLIVAT